MKIDNKVWTEAMSIVGDWLGQDCGERKEVVDSMKGSMKLTQRIAEALQKRDNAYNVSKKSPGLESAYGVSK